MKILVIILEFLKELLQKMSNTNNKTDNIITDNITTTTTDNIITDNTTTTPVIKTIPQPSDLTYQQIKYTVSKLYKRWFETPYDLNMFGIRNTNRTPNSFDDIIGVCYTDPNNKRHILAFKATTDPGKDYLLEPINEKGTGILACGYHKALWARGLHKGKPALVQVSPCQALRDNNKDAILDFDVKTKQKGMFGCNFHRANQGRQTTVVGKWSAMCQVPSHSKYVDQVLQLVKLQQKYVKANTVSYALFNLQQLTPYSIES